MKKQLLLFFLLLLPIYASADDSGTCGENLTWTYEEATNTLTISGSGDMYNYNSSSSPFNYFPILTVILESGVTSIGDYAFYQCRSLTSLTIPNSVTSIGERAFEYCSFLTSINISDIAAWCKISFVSNPLYYPHNLFLNGVEIKDLVIPNSVTCIGSYAFNKCRGLTSVTISNSVTSIGEQAFSGCSGLTSITIGNSVTNIGEQAFSGCSGLTSVTIGNSVTSIGEQAFSGCSGLISVNISDIAAWCKISFADNSSNPLNYAHNLFLNGVVIKDLVIPNSVTSIGNYAFWNCSRLTSVTIPNSVTSIGNYAFWNCSGLTSVTIPNSVTSIGDFTFYGCSSLTSITIPNGVTSIGDFTFYGCSSLTSITIGNSVTSIGNSAFSGCSGLSSIPIGNSVTSIGDYAFLDCSGLTSITIPYSVKSIGKRAFCNCYRIHTIFSLNPTPPTCYFSTFTIDASNDIRDIYDVYTYANLHVPMGSAEVYASAHDWRYFNKIKEDMEVDGNVYYANLTVKQGTTGYTRQAVKAAETYTLYIGSLGENKVNSVTFNGADVTEQVVNGYYTTPEIKGESVLSIAYEVGAAINSMSLSRVKVTGNDGKINISQIEEPAEVAVYSADGKLVETIPAAFGSVSMQAPREQVYIVKVGARTYKIAL